MVIRNLLSAGLLLLAACRGSDHAEAEAEDVAPSTEALTGGRVDRDAPASVVRLVPASDRDEPCAGVAIAPDAVLTSARCFTEYDMIGVGEPYERVEVWGHRDGVASVAIGPVRRVVLVELGEGGAHGDGAGEEGPLAIAFVDGVMTPAALPQALPAAGEAASIYGFGPDDARSDPEVTSGLVQSRGLRWGDEQSAGVAPERGSPVLGADGRVLGVAVKGHLRLHVLESVAGPQRTAALLDRLGFEGEDVLFPLVAAAGDTSIVDAVVRTLARHSRAL